MLNKLRRESQIFGAVNEVFKGVVVRESNDDFARICLEQAKALTGSQFGWVGRLNDHGLLDTLAMDAPGWDACKLPESTVVQRISDMTIRGIWGDVIKHNASLICNDPAHYPNAVGLPEGHPQINAFLGVPLKRAGKTIGMIALANKPDGYTDEDRNAIETLSMAVVEGLRRKELDALQTLVKDVAALLNVCTNIETAQKDILEQIVHIEGIHCGAFCHLNDGRMLDCAAHRTKNNLRLTASDRFILNPIGLGKLSSGESVVVSGDALREYFETSCFTVDIKSTAFIPLLFGAKLVSVIAVASLSETDFPKHIQDVLESVAALTGAAFARIESNAALEESRARFRVLFEESPVPICEVDLSAVEKYLNEHNLNSVSESISAGTHPDAPVEAVYPLIRCKSANTAAVSLFGGEDSKTLVENFYKIFCSTSSEIFFQIATNLGNGNKTFAAEMLLQTLTGKKIHTHAQWSRADDAGTGLEKVIFSSIDITALKRAEEIAWKANADLEQIFDSAADGLCVIDAAHIITKVNDRFPFLHGRSKDSVIGRDCSEIICQQTCRPQTCPLDRILAGEPRVEEDILVQRDGIQYPYLISSSPLKDANGDVMAMISVIKDMTERKRLERQLMQSQKLESIGQLAAGIAHEINTPIQYVGDNTRFLEESFGELLHLVNHVSKRKDGTTTETWEKRLDEIVDDLDAEFLTEEIPAAFSQTMEGIARVSDIVQAMKAFSHPGSDSKTETDINAAIKTTVTVARNEWKYVADVETDFDEQLPSVLCLPGELNQAFLNLIVNAAHAIGEKVSSTGEKGKIRIRTRHDEQWVEVHISDDGAGIPNEIRSRIFDPFFTTKEVGKGTGQGLAMVHTTICENHAGEIEVNSALGVGTAFIIRLPLNR